MAEYTKMDVDEITEQQGNLRKQRWTLAGIILIGVLFLIGVAAAVIALINNPAAATKIRDIFIIFLAFESMIIGVALVILVIQIASLVNLLQNEIQPILQSTTETISTLRGTTAFLSENLVEPSQDRMGVPRPRSR